MKKTNKISITIWILAGLVLGMLFGLLAVILLSNTLLSIGTPGVPGGAIASVAALASIAGLPTGIMAVYISVNTLVDMGATCCNVLGDLACSTAMKETVKND